MFSCLPSHNGPGLPLYKHVDKKILVPPPQVTEQGEDLLHDDQVGHDGMLHGSSFVRLDKPLLPKIQARGVFLVDTSSFSPESLLACKKYKKTCSDEA